MVLVLGVMALCGTRLSGVGDGSLNVGVCASDIAGNAEKGPSGFAPRLMGGLPLVLPVVPALRHADETTLAP
jgi:hypothetical protein